ncbi:CDGSH iron-sulfur domain-containing protein 2 homolog [Eumeta japonica]|uniref:CDGSH iron-sulfur domain-containing protein 2 homolog n=1 Tax=Eumeta variegata TaxID=151549 RepID=A0A4C1XKK0_EUMVA|nr:CDGSH iron-sulfur domain-containing protein 2 homolog [Eumeta japonica]
MQFVSGFVKTTVPNYLSGLPIPDSFGGWFRLGVRDWLALVPPTLAVGGISYVSYYTIQRVRENSMANPCIRKDLAKVVDFIDIEDITEKWPYCDGSHGPHNKATGDNTGPVVVRHKPKEVK